MKDKLRNLFEEQIKVTKANIKRYKSLIPVCIIIKENFHLEVIGFSFKNYEEKEQTREIIKKLILSQKIKGYMLFLDSKMTIMDNEGKKEPKVKDVVICLFCSPILRIQKGIIYDPDSKKILDIIEMFDSEKQNDDNVVSE